MNGSVLDDTGEGQQALPVTWRHRRCVCCCLMPTLQSGNEVVYNNCVMGLDSSLNCQMTQRNQ